MSETCCAPDRTVGPKADHAHAHGHDHDHGGDHGHDHSHAAATPVARVVLSAALIAGGAIAAYLGAVWPSRALFAVAVALTGGPPARQAVAEIRGRRLDIHVLLVVAAAGAIALGDWLEAASVVWLFGVAQWLEGRSLHRARQAVRSLVTLAPLSAIVRGKDGERDVPLDEVARGDIVVVRPGARVPVDGVVVDGDSWIDESPVTGESRPVDKRPGDPVFAGTINGTGAMEIETLRAAADSTLARIARLVAEAGRQRAPIQRFVDRFARRYTPSIVLLAVFVAIVPPLVIGGPHAFAIWSYRALALLVVGCPCAFVISTPVSIVSALTAAARQGVLIKGGSHLERLSTIKCVAFDKTGTLTDGRVTVSEVFPVDGRSEAGVLTVAAALESRSEHPIGRAIVDRARTAGLVVAPGEGFRALPGLGAEAMVWAAPALVGSHRLFEERQLCSPALHAKFEEVESRGGTQVLVGHNGSALGVIHLADEMRQGGRDAVADLRREGVDHVVLLTGDASANASVVRAGAGLDDAHAGLLPEDKVAHVARLRAAYGPVAMVGDGVNDAPALAAADVGIAMGVGGTAVALETADVALMSDDLSKVPYAIRLGRATVANIRLNLAVALGLKLAFVVLAVSGVATLWMAILADTGASLVVTANSLRLLRVR